MARFGYARVSADTQDYAAQVEALKSAGCQRIFTEKVSAKSTNGRTELAKLLKVIESGDTVIVTKLDRIARSSRDLHNIIHELKERKAGFVSIHDSWCDTTSDVGKLLIAIMGGIAEFERSLINQRCLAGIQRAKVKGVKFGRPEKLNSTQKMKIAERYADGETLKALADDYKVATSTIHLAVSGKSRPIKNATKA